MIVIPVPQPAPPPPARLQIPRAGDGTLVTINSHGAVFSAPTRRPSWNHPWRPAQQNLGVTFLPALVQSIAGDGPLEPKITVDGQLVPMSGQDGQSPPVLKLDPGVADSDGLSFAVLEVEPDDKGELTKDSRIEIVHSVTITSQTADVGRIPVAQIIWQDKTVQRIRPCVHFNLVYQRMMPGAGGGVPRHYFL